MKPWILLALAACQPGLAFAQAPHAETARPAPPVSRFLEYPTHLHSEAAPESPLAFLAPDWVTLSELKKAALIRDFLGRDPAAWLDINGHLPPPHYLAVALHPTDRAVMEDLLLFQQEKRWRVEIAQLLMLIMQSERTIAFYDRRTPSLRALVAKALADFKQDASDPAVDREIDKRMAQERAILADRRITYQIKIAEYESYQGDAGPEDLPPEVLDTLQPKLQPPPSH
jgi:hypothetical protein